MRHKYLITKGGSSSVAERQLPKLNVAGSIPVSRSNIFNDLAHFTLDFPPVCSISAPFAFMTATISLRMNCLHRRRDVAAATQAFIRNSGTHKTRCGGGGEIVEVNWLVRSDPAGYFKGSIGFTIRRATPGICEEVESWPGLQHPAMHSRVGHPEIAALSAMCGTNCR